MKLFGLFYVRVTRKDPEEELAAEYMKGVSDEMGSQARVDSVSGKSGDYWMGWTDGLHEAYDVRGTSRSTSARAAKGTHNVRPPRRSHAHLRLVTS